MGSFFISFNSPAATFSRSCQNLLDPEEFFIRFKVYVKVKGISGEEDFK